MNKWQQRYDTDEYIYGRTANEFILQNHSVFKGAKRLGTFAEGEGRNAVFLSEKGYMLTAFDIAQNALDKAKKLASENHVHVAERLVDLKRDETPVEEFDGAVMIFGQFEKEYQHKIFEKIVASVKKEGRIMMELYSESQLDYNTGGPKDLNLLYNPQEVLRWCEDYKIEYFFVGEVERYEGKLHNGLSHVIQLIIQK